MKRDFRYSIGCLDITNYTYFIEQGLIVSIANQDKVTIINIINELIGDSVNAKNIKTTSFYIYYSQFANDPSYSQLDSAMPKEYNSSINYLNKLKEKIENAQDIRQMDLSFLIEYYTSFKCNPLFSTAWYMMPKVCFSATFLDDYFKIERTYFLQPYLHTELSFVIGESINAEPLERCDLGSQIRCYIFTDYMIKQLENRLNGLRHSSEEIAQFELFGQIIEGVINKKYVLYVEM